MSLRDDLIRDEASVPYAYKDSKGLWTIGVGFLIDKSTTGRLPTAVRDFWLDYLIKEKMAQLDKAMPWWRGLGQRAQDALVNMCYQLGIEGLLGFQDAIAALERGDFLAAQAAFLHSKWATEDSPARARRVIALFSDLPPDGIGGTNGVAAGPNNG